MRYAVDRIIGEICVLEDLVSGEIREVSIKKLPKDVHEGSIVVLNNSVYEIDTNEELSRRKNLRERLNRLKKLKK